MEKTIHTWIKNLIIGGNLPLEMIDPNFGIEDGMNLSEYWDYEKENFNLGLKIFNLNENFKVDIFNKQALSEDKTLCFIYIINHLNEFVFKMTITINKYNKITSNNFNAQIVPKYVIENDRITKLGMAIRPKKGLAIENIISTDLEKISFGKASGFDDDAFYNAQFLVEEEIQNKTFNFHLKFDGINQKEKRKVFFDQFKKENKPYVIEENNISSKDDVYPVNLAVYYEDGSCKNYPYPRNVKLTLNNAIKAVATDVLDNDWIINFKG